MVHVADVLGIGVGDPADGRSPCPFSVRFSTEIPVQMLEGQTGEDEPNRGEETRPRG